MNDTYVIWAVIFLAAALVLFIIELVLPSAGIIAILAAVSLVAGIVMLFKLDTTIGLIGATVTVIGAPFLFALALKLWPNTPIARLVMLRHEQARLTGDQRETAADDGPQVGARGTAVTDLRPVGTCLIDGQRIECLAEGGVIRAQTPVRVVACDGMQIKVRPDDE
ncbi:MAG: hypothetical protein K8S99_08260 [Planctomycetes bacterium]|nr:hypothetical protein [Planctomycetota bacterium]